MRFQSFYGSFEFSCNFCFSSAGNFDFAAGKGGAFNFVIVPGALGNSYFFDRTAQSPRIFGKTVAENYRCRSHQRFNIQHLSLTDLFAVDINFLQIAGFALSLPLDSLKNRCVVRPFPGRYDSAGTDTALKLFAL
jgi:hypothetical protein